MSINREQRRQLKRKMAPTAKRIAELERLARDPEHKEEAETEIGKIMDSLPLLEMMAIQDYIESKGLLNNFTTHDNK